MKSIFYTYMYFRAIYIHTFVIFSSERLVIYPYHQNYQGRLEEKERERERETIDVQILFSVWLRSYKMVRGHCYKDKILQHIPDKWVVKTFLADENLCINLKRPNIMFHHHLSVIHRVWHYYYLYIFTYIHILRGYKVFMTHRLHWTLKGKEIQYQISRLY